MGSPISAATYRLKALPGGVQREDLVITETEAFEVGSSGAKTEAKAVARGAVGAQGSVGLRCAGVGALVTEVGGYDLGAGWLEWQGSQRSIIAAP